MDRFVRGQGVHHEIGRFILVGLTNMTVTYTIYLICLLFLQPVASMLIATGTGLVYSTLMNIRLVFRRQLRLLVFFLTAAYYLFYCVANVLLLAFLIERFSIASAVAPIFVMCALVPIHFVLTRYIVKGWGT